MSGLKCGVLGVIERELRFKIEGELSLGENESFLFLSNNEGSVKMEEGRSIYRRGRKLTNQTLLILNVESLLEVFHSVNP